MDRFEEVARAMKELNDWADLYEYDDEIFEEENNDCSWCGGSGGGPDPALRCPECRGTGRAPAVYLEV